MNRLLIATDSERAITYLFSALYIYIVLASNGGCHEFHSNSCRGWAVFWEFACGQKSGANIKATVFEWFIVWTCQILCERSVWSHVQRRYRWQTIINFSFIDKFRLPTCYTSHATPWLRLISSSYVWAVCVCAVRYAVFIKPYNNSQTIGFHNDRKRAPAQRYIFSRRAVLDDQFTTKRPENQYAADPTTVAAVATWDPTTSLLIHKLQRGQTQNDGKYYALSQGGFLIIIIIIVPLIWLRHPLNLTSI